MTTADTQTLAAWLLAALAEDEAAALHHQSLGADFIGYDTGAKGDGWAGSAGEYDPARVLAQVAAHRAIVELHASGPWDSACSDQVWDVRPDDCPTLRALASIYADRAGFDPRWAAE